MAFVVALAVGTWAVLFVYATNFGFNEIPSNQETVRLAQGASILIVSVTLLAQMTFYAPIYPCSLVIVGLTLLQSRPYLEFVKKELGSFLVLKNLKPKPLLYPVMTGSMFLLFCLYQVVDSWQQEGDYTTDGLLLLCLAFMWITQPQHLRYRDVGAACVIVACVKVVYFVDRESSMNFETHE